MVNGRHGLVVPNGMEPVRLNYLAAFEEQIVLLEILLSQHTTREAAKVSESSVWRSFCSRADSQQRQ
jgi:hypothetical protein